MESELDERMTDEAKTFVSNNLKAMRPLEMIKADINTVRAARITNAQRINGALTFENLTISKFIVKNPSDGYEIEVTCYKPVDAKESAPITVYFHGGGWTFNSVSVYDASVSSLAANSKTVWLSVEYRLSPENKYPTPLNDCIEVVKYVHANKEQFSSRSAKVGVSGDSSGGHFAALVSLDYSDLVDFQILIYPSLYLGKDNSYPSHLEFTRDCYLIIPEVMDFFISNFTGGDDNVRMSPDLNPMLRTDFQMLPKTLLLLAELDPLRDESIEYHKKLTECQVDSSLHVVNGVQHGFFNNPILLKNAFEELQQQVVKFFEKF